MTPYYYHCDTTDPSYSTIEEQAAVEHSQGAPGCLLSVFRNVSVTESFIKVVSKQSDYVAPFENSPAVIAVYTEIPSSVMDLLCGPLWNDPNLPNPSLPL